MVELIVAIGLLLVVASTVILVKPNLVFGYLLNHIEKYYIYWSAIVARLLIGLLLISLSSESLFPLITRILGFITLGVGAVLLMIGKENFQNLGKKVLNMAEPFGRIGGILGLVFGLFLIHAFIHS